MTAWLLVTTAPASSPFNGTFLIAAATAVGLLITAIVGVAKLRPENAKAIVAAATELADDQREWGAVLKKETVELREINTQLSGRMSRLHEELVQARDELTVMRREHAAELAQVRRERDDALALVETMRAEVASFRQEVARLTSELQGRRAAGGPATT